MDYTQMKVGDIRDKLVEGGMTIQEAADIKGKANLVEALESMDAAISASPAPEVPLMGDMSIEEGQQVLNNHNVDPDADVDFGSDSDLDALLSGIGESDIGEISAIFGDQYEEKPKATPPPALETEPVVRDVVRTETTITSTEHVDIMSLFDDSELADGKYPKAVGLRRVAEDVLGKIVRSGPTQVIMSQDHNGLPMATIVYELVFVDGTVVSDIADCWVGNTPDTFAVHPSATASTRAEGRALRKALKLNVVTAEEMDNDKDATEMLKPALSTDSVRNVMDELEKDTITATQAAVITSKCSTFGIEVEKFINKMFYTGKSDKKAYDSIDEVPYSIAQAMIGELNNYQGTEQNELSKGIPPEIKIVNTDAQKKN